MTQTSLKFGQDASGVDGQAVDAGILKTFLEFVSEKHVLLGAISVSNIEPRTDGKLRVSISIPCTFAMLI